MKIAVIGASGRLGSAVAREALARGHRVTAVSRDAARLDSEYGLADATPAVADVTDPPSIARAVAGHDAVVTAIKGDGEPPRRIIADAARTLLGALTGTGVGRLVFLGGGASITNELKTLFRPSDVCVGPDGAIYVADWFDPGVGGHGTRDDRYTGSIYRIAPKGFRSVVPKLDLTTTEGQIAALKSPAVNVRNSGFTRLKAQGAKAVPAVAALLDDKNPYIAARAVWLLAQTQYPDINVEAYQALLDSFAAELRERLDLTREAKEVLTRINSYLFEELGFSGNEEKITFSLLIKNHSGILFDSTLSPFKIKDIPDSTAKLVFDKNVPNDDGSELAAGFRYDIDGVGNSSYLDTCSAGEMFKAIDFSFK